MRGHTSEKPYLPCCPGKGMSQAADGSIRNIAPPVPPSPGRAYTAGTPPQVSLIVPARHRCAPACHGRVNGMRESLRPAPSSRRPVRRSAARGIVPVTPCIRLSRCVKESAKTFSHLSGDLSADLYGPSEKFPDNFP